eukprot:m.278826 g.278826  ORF g.278826 m.278826 type:complete len:2990 (+) comp17719_c0_seq2:308-9277(+)
MLLQAMLRQILISLAVVALTHASCPSSSTTIANSLCSCPPNSRCNSGATNNFGCAINVQGDEVFNPAACTTCTCQLENTIYQVSEPSFGTVCTPNQICPVAFQGNAQFVTIYLAAALAVGGGSSMRILPLQVLYGNGRNLGTFNWTVPRDLPPKDNYVIFVALPGDNSTFALSPIFSVATTPSGPCPSGFTSADGNQPCTACPQGTYANSTTTCLECPTGITTLGTGSVNVSMCSLSQDDRLAKFTLYRGRLLDASSIATYSDLTLERCAELCQLDQGCKSFDYIASTARVGACELNADNQNTSLTHTFVFGAQNASQHYEKQTSQPILDAAFNKLPNAYIQLATSVLEPVPMSLEACAVRCLRNSNTCQAFAGGNRGRQGACVLYALNSSSAGDSLKQDNATGVHQLDLYDKILGGVPCTPGSVSATGTQSSTCLPCERGSYSSSAFACSLCPADRTTTGTGAASVSSCQLKTCPPGSLGPSLQGICTCPTGAACQGSDCTCSSGNCTMGGGQFIPEATNATCLEVVDPPSIDFVFTPKAADNLYYGESYNITYQASNGVSLVQIALYQGIATDLSRVTFVQTISFFTENTGIFNWTVPSTLAVSDLYMILIFHYKFEPPIAPTFRNSAYFSVKARPVGDCPPGQFNSATGKQPCTLCPAGTYSNTTLACAICPPGTTTLDPGSLAASDCSVNASSPLFQFQKFPNSFLAGNNAGGGFIEEVDHKTVEECAKLCLADAGCKSFDAGVPSLFQAGDCFLSYDNRATVPKASFRSISQLDYYERRDYTLVAATNFKKTAGCYIQGSDNGGVFQSTHTVEACAQLCLNDVCCKSFDAGQVGGPREADCFLAYETKAQVPAGDYVCNSTQQLDYYEKKLQSDVEFNYALLSANDYPVFAARAVTAARALDGLLQTADLQASAFNSSTNGRVIVRFVFEDPTAQALLEASVSSGKLAFPYPSIFDSAVTGSFALDAGPCPFGTISATGDRGADENCRTCSANAYSNKAQTVCQQCPSGKSSLPGTNGLEGCTSVSSSGSRQVFETGDVWKGSFADATCVSSTGTTYKCDGQLELRVVDVDDSVKLLATMVHGQYCDISKFCRIESAGISSFYYTAKASGSSVTAIFDPGLAGWTGITDRSFTRQNLVGTISPASGGRLSFSGNYGSATGATFTVTQQCSIKNETSTFAAGDAWVGTYRCAANRSLVEGQTVVRRMELQVRSVAGKGVQAFVNFDHSAGIGQYAVTTMFDDNSICSALELVPTAQAWQTVHPKEVNAFVLAARVSPDRASLSGQLNFNPACECLNRAEDVKGGTCADHDGDGEPWCYVDGACPEATRQSNGRYRLLCGIYPECFDFTLARTCASTDVVCDVGYKAHNGRCYLAKPELVSYAVAEQNCLDEQATLVSIRTREENMFVANLLATALANQTNTSTNANTTSTGWIGYKRGLFATGFAWEDGSPSGSFNGSSSGAVPSYAPWAVGYPTDRLPACTVVNTTSGEWTDVDCEVTRGSVCKKAPLGLNTSCGCLNTTVEGSYCDSWNNKFGFRWCYVDEGCSQAVEVNTTGRFIRSCEESPDATTTTAEPPSCHELDETAYTKDDGSCGTCTASCASGQVLVGVCTELTTPICLPCHSSCGACTGLTAADCTTCASGFVRNSMNTSCVSQCPLGEYRDDAAAKCSGCDTNCASCTGPSSQDCNSCAGGLILTLNNECATGCTLGSFANNATGSCLPCSKCKSGLFQAEACTVLADTECQTWTTCNSEQFESAAPTNTSNRVCKGLAPCNAGQFQTTAATATSDRLCVPCQAGTTDIDGDPLTACEECFEGTQSTAGWVGPCLMCTPGFYDDDKKPSTPCVQCPINTFTAVRGSVTCQPVAECTAGQQEAVAPNAARTADRVCLNCPDGTWSPGGDTSCKAYTICPAGQEPLGIANATQDRVCVPCGAQTYKQQTGNFACQAFSTCPAGEQLVLQGNATNDVTCDTCPRNTFNPTPGGNCQTVTSCKATEFVSTAASAINDNTCTSLANCSSQQFVLVFPTLTSNRVCSDLTTCSSAEWEDNAPVKDVDSGLFVTDRICQPCTDCTKLGQIQQRACNATADAVCDSCEPCKPGITYETTPCQGTTDRTCAPCDVCNPIVTFEAKPCLPSGQNRVCQAFTVCGSSEYELLPPTSNSDRLCRALTRCLPGFVQDASPTATSDRTCKPCQLGVTFERNGLCFPVNPCEPGSEQTAPATLSSDRVCTRCPSGTFNLDGVGQCNPVAACGAGSFIQTASTRSSDRVCATCDVSLGLYSPTANLDACLLSSICEPSQFLVPSQNSTRPGSCRSCPAGTFSSSNNSLACTAFRDCPAGQGATKEGTNTADRECQPCVAGSTFSAQESNASCTPVRQCGAGAEEQTPPSVIADRTCQSCTDGLTYQDRNGTTRPCQPVSPCPAGSQVLAAPTTTSDRTCEACPDQFYSDRAGTSACKPYSPSCSAGFKQTEPPSRFRDRTCTPCLAANAEYQNLPGQTSCNAWTTCQPGSFVDVEGTPTSDRSCASCEPGTFSISTNVASCTPCVSGTNYQDQPNAISCKSIGTCVPGTAVASFATASRDTICEACDGIVGYSDTANLPACLPIRTCSSTELKRERSPPSSFQNRQCECILGQSYQLNSYSDSKPCLAATVCRISAGEVVFREATLTSDRVCIPADGDGTLKLVADADFASVLPTLDDQSDFAALLKARLLAIPDVASNTAFITQMEAGSIVANLRVSNATTIPIIDDFAEGLALSVFFKGKSYLMLPVGPCPPGEFSSNGQKPGCDPCKANQVPDEDRKSCVSCPSGSFSLSGDAECQPDPSASRSGKRSDTSLIIGVVVGVVVLLALLLFCYFRHRTSKDYEFDPRAGDGRPSASAYVNPLYDTHNTPPRVVDLESEPGAYLDVSNMGAEDGYANMPSTGQLTGYSEVDGTDGGYADLSGGSYMDIALNDDGASYMDVSDAGNDAGYMDVEHEPDDSYVEVETGTSAL